MIWLDGECLCPECYKLKRHKYDTIYNQGYEAGKKSNRKD